MKKPQIGELVCDCKYKHQKIVLIESDGDTVELEDGTKCSYKHCCDSVPHDFKH